MSAVKMGMRVTVPPSLMESAVHTFQDEVKAREWFFKRCPDLHGAPPAEILNTLYGERLIQALLQSLTPKGPVQ